jgi:NAD(P)-dependent dehydrogenase (short-subunit alcohol dehydrogenase family)
MTGMLAGRVAIVTGGGRGIGRRHAIELASQGATVVVNDLGVGVHGEDPTESPADEVVADIDGAGGTAVSDGTSVTDWDGIAGLIARTVDDFGRLDIIVNNAGIVRDRMITSLSEDDWDAVIAVHVKGTFTVTKHACDHWRAVAKAGGEVSGRVINTTSGTGLFGNIGQSPYGAAKAAIANLTIITAMEMQRYDVTANAISPLAATRMAATSTAMAGYDGSDRWDRLDPGNSSPVVAWLASKESGWLTGQVLRVDGNSVQRVKTWELTGEQYIARGGERLDVSEIGTAMRLLYGVVPAGIPGTGLKPV